MVMSVPNLSEAVAAALAKLKALEQSQPSSTTDKELLQLSDELRKLRKQLHGRINALPWNQEKKALRDLLEKVDRVLSAWEYEIEVDVSPKRLNELEEKLSAGALNDSTRRKLQSEQRRILALQKKAIERAGATSAAKSTPRATKSVAEKIAEYEALRARALGSGKDES